MQNDKLALFATTLTYDEIIDIIEDKLREYKKDKAVGPGLLSSAFALFVTKMHADERCNGDFITLLKDLKKAEASRQLFETNPQ